MQDLASWVGAAGGTGVLVAVVGAFLKSILAAQAATADQNAGWKSILDTKETENDRLRRHLDRLEEDLRKSEAENYSLRRRLGERGS